MIFVTDGNIMLKKVWAERLELKMAWKSALDGLLLVMTPFATSNICCLTDCTSSSNLLSTKKVRTERSSANPSRDVLNCLQSYGIYQNVPGPIKSVLKVEHPKLVVLQVFKSWWITCDIRVSKQVVCRHHLTICATNKWANWRSKAEGLLQSSIHYLAPRSYSCTIAIVGVQS